ncbi:chloramphenicol acetyltransferase [Cryobacterium roopkundense]|uniref:Chloramphenicol acetyltransferase n=1 Tax=Cryobacterium roopkundense TaxID=1001240 RepID=A0A099JBC0_9MICO|nr:chloramphenicol acetyltransferase CAT [Cryobacterium roopkundense]KGJ75679.1 chloramphenicol acetyltransferase [Cryobacterium roopkundense]MBB5641129.1 chloramphenicol O-acetyltransferase type A [Cryobacterium roopkundense]
MTEKRAIDLDTWPRREHFEHYLTRVECTYAMTVELDVTEMVAALRVVPWKSYIAQIWAIASVVNRHAEFRMTLTADEAPATWDIVHPAFTVFNPERETFANVWSPFHNDFSTFHERTADVLARYRTATSFQPQPDIPSNVFDISSVPWASFTGFSLQTRDGWKHLSPIFTLGRYRETEGRTVMPVAIQVHHAAADGFHTARIVQELQELFSDPGWLPK